MHITLCTEVVRFPVQGSIMSEDDRMFSSLQRIEFIFLANDYKSREQCILQTLLRLMKMEERFVPFKRTKQTKTGAHSPA